MGTQGHRILQAALIAWCLPAPGFAQTPCSSLTDPAARLACFDKQEQQPAAKPKPKTDAAFDKAKSAVTELLKDPGSATFGPMSRANRPNVKGEPTDVICGTVNARNSYGGYTGSRPFVFFVRDSRANLVDLSPDPSDVSGIIYRRFCASP